MVHSGRCASREPGAARRQPEEYAVRGELAAIAGAIGGRHIEHQMLDAARHQPRCRLARQEGRRCRETAARRICRARWAACGSPRRAPPAAPPAGPARPCSSAARVISRSASCGSWQRALVAVGRRAPARPSAAPRAAGAAESAIDVRRSTVRCADALGVGAVGVRRERQHAAVALAPRRTRPLKSPTCSGSLVAGCGAEAAQSAGLEIEHARQAHARRQIREQRYAIDVQACPLRALIASHALRPAAPAAP